MTPAWANLVNAFSLLICGGWAYALKGTPSSLIPFFGGLLLWSITGDIRQGDSSARTKAMILTVTLIVFLFLPLMKEIHLGDMLGVSRILTMMGTSVTALWILFRFFRTAKIN
jgi:hypothetical protein